MKKALPLLFICTAVFAFVRFASHQTPALTYAHIGEDYHEECENEGCNTEEQEENHEYYESECFEESCQIEEVRETAGRWASINNMLNDFAARGWRINGCHFIGPCAYSPGDNNASGDNAFIGFCTNASISQHWSDFDFDQGDWDDGFGYFAPCNVNQPLARTFNALNLLDFFGTSMPSGSSNWLPWFYAFASNAIDELDARCDTGRPNGCTFARTRWGPLIDNWTQLYWPFFYGLNVPSRAGTIVHEARHADGQGHDGGGGCPRGVSCDSSWGYNGANNYQVVYLWWVRAAGTGLSPAIRQMAQVRGNQILGNGFNTRPTRAQVLGSGVSNPTAPFAIP